MVVEFQPGVALARAHDPNQVFLIIAELLGSSPLSTAVGLLDSIVHFCETLRGRLTQDCGPDAHEGVDQLRNDKTGNTPRGKPAVEKAIASLLDVLHKRHAKLDAMFNQAAIAATVEGCFATSLFETFKKLNGKSSQQRFELAVLSHFFHFKWEICTQRQQSYTEFLEQEQADKHHMETATKMGNKIERMERLLPGAGFLVAQSGEHFRRFPQGYERDLVNALREDVNMMNWSSELASVGSGIKQRANHASVESTEATSNPVDGGGRSMLDRSLSVRLNATRTPTPGTTGATTIASTAPPSDVGRTGSAGHWHNHSSHTLPVVTLQPRGHDRASLTPNVGAEMLHGHRLVLEGQSLRNMQQDGNVFVDFYGTSTTIDPNFLDPTSLGALSADPPVDFNDLYTNPRAFPDFRDMDTSAHVASPYFAVESFGPA